MQGGDVKFLNEEHSHKSLSYVKQPVTKSVCVCGGTTLSTWSWLFLGQAASLATLTITSCWLGRAG